MMMIELLCRAYVSCWYHFHSNKVLSLSL